MLPGPASASPPPPAAVQPSSLLRTLHAGHVLDTQPPKAPTHLSCSCWKGSRQWASNPADTRMMSGRKRSAAGATTLSNTRSMLASPA